MSAKRTLDFGSATPMAKRVKNLEQQVRQNKQELRYHDFVVTNNQLDNFKTIELMDGILKGTDQDNRSGNAIQVKKIEIFVNKVSEEDRLRMILYSPNDVGNQIATPDAAPFNLIVKRDQFRVWSDVRHAGTIVNVGPTAQGYGGRQIHVSKTWAIPMKVVYKDNSTLSHNDVFLTIFKESADAAKGIENAGNANLGINLNGRIYFYDM